MPMVQCLRAMDNVSVTDAIKALAFERRLPANYCDRWLAQDDRNRAAIYEVVDRLRMRTGQIVAMLDLLDEIGVRERTDAASILAAERTRAVLDAGGSGPARAARLLDLLREIRYPRLTRLRSELEAEISRFGLPQSVTVRLPVDLASDELMVEIRAHSGKEMDQALSALMQTRDRLVRIVGRLGGSDEI
jgi:hypothetical protein